MTFQKEDIWLYKFCVGESVDQYHVELNGTFSEEFSLGKSNMSSEIEAMSADINDFDDDPIQDMILFDNQTPYMMIDHKSGGYIIRVFNSNLTKSHQGQKMKNDMIAVTYPVREEDGSQGHLRQDTRVIIEVVNDYTFVLDRPFDASNLPEHILDFKFI